MFLHLAFLKVVVIMNWYIKWFKTHRKQNRNSVLTDWIGWYWLIAVIMQTVTRLQLSNNWRRTFQSVRTVPYIWEPLVPNSKQSYCRGLWSRLLFAKPQSQVGILLQRWLNNNYKCVKSINAEKYKAVFTNLHRKLRDFFLLKIFLE